MRDAEHISSAPGPLLWPGHLGGAKGSEERCEGPETQTQNAGRLDAFREETPKGGINPSPTVLSPLPCDEMT